MIKLENTEVLGWEASIRGCRNPMNSWEKSDSAWSKTINTFEDNIPTIVPRHYDIGPNDHDLMMRLAKAGSVDAKYRRMIVVTVDIAAPLYWWKEFDTYKVGTVANSCSTMHKIQAKEFDMRDFSFEHLFDQQDDKYACFTDLPFADKDSAICPQMLMWELIKMLNKYRELYLETKDKRYWWQMIQLLPSSYNQRRTVMLNYEVLAGIYPKRKSHKLDEWHDFCAWIESLPYSEIITLQEGDIHGEQDA